MRIMGPTSKRFALQKQDKSVARPEAVPNWPLLKPLVPHSDLAIQTLVPSQILTISRFFTQSLCKTYVSFLKSLPLKTTPGVPKRGEALRFNDRFQVNDARFAEMLWEETGLRELLSDPENVREEASSDAGMSIWGGEPIGLNPSIRIYRYTKGQYFDCHYDESNSVSFSSSAGPVVAKTTWTLLLYLTSEATGCMGGETVFYPEQFHAKERVLDREIIVKLEAGMCLLHRHGTDCMLHEGRQVLAGEKWVIRTDLCVKASGKPLVARS